MALQGSWPLPKALLILSLGDIFTVGLNKEKLLNPNFCSYISCIRPLLPLPAAPMPGMLCHLWPGPAPGAPLPISLLSPHLPIENSPHASEGSFKILIWSLNSLTPLLKTLQNIHDVIQSPGSRPTNSYMIQPHNASITLIFQQSRFTPTSGPFHLLFLCNPLYG